MQQTPEFEAEIVIDENGKITLRNCSQDMLELLYQLNPKDNNLRKRIKMMRKTHKSNGESI